MEEEGVDCPICFNMIVEPTRIICGHVYCLSCVEKVVISGDIRCPYDRKPFDYQKDLKLDKRIQQQNLDKDKKTFYETATKLLEYRKTSFKLEEYTLNFGNYHSVIDSTNQNRHKWTSFVYLTKLNNGIKETVENLRKEADLELLVNYGEHVTDCKRNQTPYDLIPEEKVIKKVTFYLHPTFTQSVIEVEKAPFTITRIGWGAFNVTMKVEFQDYLNMEPMELDHFLCFSQELCESFRKVYINVDKVLTSSDHVNNVNSVNNVKN
jgi:hypothetical protein